MRFILTLGAVSATVVLAAGASGQVTTRASVHPTGREGRKDSRPSHVSANGRFIGFSSESRQFVSGDTNHWSDAFLHDRLTGVIERVSVNSSEQEGNANSDTPLITADGRYVVFHSDATNLEVGSSTNDQIYLRDRLLGTTARLLFSVGGGHPDGWSRVDSISSDGRFVGFSSQATNLVADPGNLSWHAYVLDRQTGVITRESVGAAGQQGDGWSFNVSVSDDGRLVTFESSATNLVPGDANKKWDVFCRDRALGTTVRVSLAGSGSEIPDHSYTGGMSANGKVAVLWTWAPLLAGDLNNTFDVYARDLVTWELSLVSATPAGYAGNGQSGYPSVSSTSADGRYVAFESYANDLGPADANNFEDIYVHDRLTGQNRLVSISTAGNQGDGSWNRTSVISADARFVAFQSSSTNLVSGDTNDVLDVFVHGAWLTLDANPLTASASDRLTLVTFHGDSGDPAALFVTAVDGAPLSSLVFTGIFNPAGFYTLTFAVPDDWGFETHDVTFQAFALAPNGNVEATNSQTVSFH